MIRDVEIPKGPISVLMIALKEWRRNSEFVLVSFGLFFDATK